MKRSIMLMLAFAMANPLQAGEISWKKVTRAFKTEAKSRVTAIVGSLVGIGAVVGIALFVKRRTVDPVKQPLLTEEDDSSASSSQLSIFEQAMLDTKFENQLNQIKDSVLSSSLHSNANFNQAIKYLDQGADGAATVEGYNILELACAAGNMAAAEKIVEKCSDIEKNRAYFFALQTDRAQQYQNQSGSGYASWHNKQRKPLLELLLENGANLNYCDKGGSALHRAFSNQDNQLSAFLLHKGIKTVGVLNSKGETAYEVAQ